MWIEAYFILPIVLLGEELVVSGQIRWGFFVIAASVCLSVYVGMPEVLFLNSLFASCYGVYRLLESSTGRRLGSLFSPRGTALIFSWVVGFALGAPLLVPFLEYIRNASTVTSIRGAMGLWHANVSDVFAWFIPFLMGLPNESISHWQVAAYVGTTVLILAIVGSLPSRDVVYLRLAPFALAFAVLILAKIYGAPVLNDIGSLPGFSLTVVPRWGAPLVCFCLALLASVGLHRIVTYPVDARSSWIAFVIVFWLIVAVISINWTIIRGLPPEPLRTAVVTAIFFATLVIVVARWRTKSSSTPLGYAYCGLVWLELFIYSPHDSYQDRKNPFTEPPFVTYLKTRQSEGPFRVFSGDGMLFPDTASAFGLDDIRALDGLYIGRYFIYVRKFLEPSAFDRFTGGPVGSNELPSIISDNPWFNVAGVRFVIAAAGSSAAPGELAEKVRMASALSADCQPRNPPCTSIGALLDGRIPTVVLEEDAPASVGYNVEITPANDILRFTLTLMPQATDSSRSEGVAFEVTVTAEGQNRTVFSRDLTLSQYTSEPQLPAGEVNLETYIGHKITITFHTSPLGRAVSAGAGWGDLRLEAPANPNAQFNRVYSGDAQVFENRAAFPRAFLVQNVVSVPSIDAAVTLMESNTFDPAKSAVVEGVSETETKRAADGAGSARVRYDTFEGAAVDVRAERDSLLVLTDSYYPGWIALVDGQPVPIYPVDVAFRGILVPTGNHVVQFVYRPLSFTVGVLIAVCALVVLLAIVAGLGPKNLDAHN